MVLPAARCPGAGGPVWGHFSIMPGRTHLVHHETKTSFGVVIHPGLVVTGGMTLGKWGGSVMDAPGWDNRSVTSPWNSPTVALPIYYWQFSLTPKATQKIAFNTARGNWQYWVFPFGLHRALDDVVIHSTTWKDHHRQTWSENTISGKCWANFVELGWVPTPENNTWR